FEGLEVLLVRLQPWKFDLSRWLSRAELILDTFQPYGCDGRLIAVHPIQSPETERYPLRQRFLKGAFGSKALEDAVAMGFPVLAPLQRRNYRQGRVHSVAKRVLRGSSFPPKCCRPSGS